MAPHQGHTVIQVRPSHFPFGSMALLAVRTAALWERARPTSFLTLPAVGRIAITCCSPQIRRYVYCDVIRSVDISQFMDVAGVQSYIINQARVAFLNPRPQSKVGKPMSPDTCRTCARHLREGAAYCSIACKVRCAELSLFGADLRGSVHSGRATVARAVCISLSPTNTGGGAARR